MQELRGHDGQLERARTAKPKRPKDRRQAGEDCKRERGARNPCPLKPATGQPIQTPVAAFNGAGGGVRRETREDLQDTGGGRETANTSISLSARPL